MGIARQGQVVLSVAGFDPSSGAGVTADLQTIAAHGFFGCSVPTAITVQSTTGVRRVEPLAADVVREALYALEEDMPAKGIKIGMLASAEVVATVCDFVTEVRRRRRVMVVLDPVLRSSSGVTLLEPRGLELMRERLLPVCDVVTPNEAEMWALLGREDGASDPVGACRELAGLFPGLGLVVTGGDAAVPDDLVMRDGGEPVWIRGTRIETTSTHGTGCAFSSALLCRMLVGDDLERAAGGAKTYVEGALRTAVTVGHGRGPMNLLWTRPFRGAERED